MKVVPIHEAKTHLSRLVQRACEGEEVIISRGRKPVVRLVRVDQAAPARKFGALQGRISIDDTFFEPLPEDALAAWEK